MELYLTARGVWRPRKAMRANNVRPYSLYDGKKWFFDKLNRRLLTAVQTVEKVFCRGAQCAPVMLCLTAQLPGRI